MFLGMACFAADERPGLALGAEAPEFKLLDQSGVERSSAELRGDGYLAVVFHRSADW